MHGPQPRSYDQRTPKKMKAAALRGALSDRARDGRIHVVDGFGLGDAPVDQDRARLARRDQRPAPLPRRARAHRRRHLALAAQRARGAHRGRRPAQHLRRGRLRRRGLHPGRLRRVRDRHRASEQASDSVVEAPAADAGEEACQEGAARRPRPTRTPRRSRRRRPRPRRPPRTADGADEDAAEEESEFASTLHKDHRDILIAPVVSEKSYGLLDANKYTFLVHPDANKTEIKIAVEKVFNVKVTGRQHAQPPGQDAADPQRAGQAQGHQARHRQPRRGPPHRHLRRTGFLGEAWPFASTSRPPRAVAARRSPTSSRSPGPRRRSP